MYKLSREQANDRLSCPTPVHLAENLRIDSVLSRSFSLPHVKPVRASVRTEIPLNRVGTAFYFLIVHPLFPY